MSYYVVKEHQICIVEYIVKADSKSDAISKAKILDQDSQEISNGPVFVESKNYTAVPYIDTGDSAILRAISLIEENYEEGELVKPTKRKSKPKPKTDKALSSADIAELLKEGA